MNPSVEISFFWLMLAVAFAVGIFAGRYSSRPAREYHDDAIGAAEVLHEIVLYGRDNGGIFEITLSLRKRAINALARLGWE